MEISAFTDIGNVRETNQDAYRAGTFKSGAVWAVVCDGMGGVSGGSVASEMCAETVAAHIKKAFRANMTVKSIKNLLCSAIIAANIEVFETGRENNDLKGMGTTIVAAIISGGFSVIAHVGDSRAYIVNDEIRQITKDHSIVQYMIDSGKITSQQAKTHPDRNIITRAIGVDAVVDVDIDVEDVADGNVLLICTDGLTGYVSDSDMFDLIKNTDFNNSAKVLVKKASENGGRDNITAVTVSC